MCCCTVVDIVLHVYVFGINLRSRTSKSRSKREKKRWSLKEGSPYEDFALADALRNLVEQTATWKGVPSLLIFLNNDFL